WWSTPVGPAAAGSALCSVYPVILTLETRGHVCQNFITPQKKISISKFPEKQNAKESLRHLISCRRRSRTFTEQLAKHKD
ncbi:MAG: hypothetical protein V4717_17980, partial [Bacteroidota bacterium]